MTSTRSIEGDWRWCSKCAGLIYFGWAVCPAGRAHDHSQSVNYSLRIDSSRSPGPSSWRRCKKCQGLSLTSHGETGPCPHSGRHDTSGSADYTLLRDQEDNAAGQRNWRLCDKCHGLFWAGGSPPGTCSAGGVHSSLNSGNYTVSLDGDNAAAVSEKHWRWCRNCMLLCYDGSAACAAGGAHLNFCSGFYTLPQMQNDPSVAGPDTWRWCNKCYGLYFAGRPSAGACPGTGLHDPSDSSSSYVLRRDRHPGAQNHWSCCDKCHLLWFSGNGMARCPAAPVAYHDNRGSPNYAIDHEPTAARLAVRFPPASAPRRGSLSTRRNGAASQENPPPPYSAAPLGAPSAGDEESRHRDSRAVLGLRSALTGGR